MLTLKYCNREFFYRRRSRDRLLSLDRDRFGDLFDFLGGGDSLFDLFLRLRFTSPSESDDEDELDDEVLNNQSDFGHVLALSSYLLRLDLFFFLVF